MPFAEKVYDCTLSHEHSVTRRTFYCFARFKSQHFATNSSQGGGHESDATITFS